MTNSLLSKVFVFRLLGSQLNVLYYSDTMRLLSEHMPSQKRQCILIPEQITRTSRFILVNTNIYSATIDHRLAYNIPRGASLYYVYEREHCVVRFKTDSFDPVL